MLVRNQVQSWFSSDREIYDELKRAALIHRYNNPICSYDQTLFGLGKYERRPLIQGLINLQMIGSCSHISQYLRNFNQYYGLDIGKAKAVVMRLISIESGEDEVAFHSNIPLLKLQSYTNYAYCAIDVRFGNRGIYESILNLENDRQNLNWILDIERLNKMSIITGRMAMSIRKMQATFTFDLYLSVTAPNLAAKSTLEMI